MAGKRITRSLLTIAALGVQAVVLARRPQDEEVHYGVDVSYPMHHPSASTNYAELPHNVDPANHPVPAEYLDMPVQPLGNKQQFYEDFIQACRDFHGERGHMCDHTENDRIKMSIEQPQSMRNYTETGFAKIRAPDELFQLLKAHWERNQDLKKEEKWPTGSTYVNYWESPTNMASVEDSDMRGGGTTLQQTVYSLAKPVLEEWTGEKLKPTSLYGVREYTTGAVLAPHVDRNPLIISCIINVDQDVDEDWPLEVIGHNGRAYNVTMEPGDMVLYESHSVIHSRPFPMKGRSFANTFVHFEPAISQHTTELPTFILEGSITAQQWWQNNPGGGEDRSPSVTTLQTDAHDAARDGDIDTLLGIAEKKGPQGLLQLDENGWEPLHEAIRSGHVDVVSFLIEQGSDINTRTHDGRGGTALWWSKRQHDDEMHPVTRLLQSLGGMEVGPDL